MKSNCGTHRSRVREGKRERANSQIHTRNFRIIKCTQRRRPLESCSGHRDNKAAHLHDARRDNATAGGFMCATWGRKLIQMKCAREGKRWESVGKASSKSLDIICCDFSILGHLGLALICANRRKCQTSQRKGSGNWYVCPSSCLPHFRT